MMSLLLQRRMMKTFSFRVLGKIPNIILGSINKLLKTTFLQKTFRTYLQ